MISENWPAIFCANVRALRLKKNLSIPEMAEILGLSPELLTLLEAAVLTEDMTIEILDHIHRHFGVTPNQILADSALPEQAKAPP